VNEGKLIVLFDGVCNLCNGWVQLIIRNDKKDVFRFAPLQSDAAAGILSEAKYSSVPAESVILIEGGNYYFRSSAALRIFSHLNGMWKLMIVFYIVPVFIRDAVYDFIARNRYRWFGKRNTCMVPDEKQKSKFI